jgi:hypothetical protein
VDEAARQMQQLDATRRTYTEMAQRWRMTIEVIERLFASSDEDDTGPFDIEDYTRAAESWTETATRMEALADRLAALQGGAPETTDEARRLVDHITLRVIQVIVAVLVAAIVYFAARRPVDRGRSR